MNEEEKGKPEHEGLCRYGFRSYPSLGFICDERVGDGETLCVAHKKERTQEELKRFGEIVRDRMERKDEKRYDFRGFRFPTGFNDFNDATFEGDVDFRHSHFEDSAHFHRATIEGDADAKDIRRVVEEEVAPLLEDLFRRRRFRLEGS